MPLGEDLLAWMSVERGHVEHDHVRAVLSALHQSPLFARPQSSFDCCRVETRAVQPSPEIWLRRVSLGRHRVEIRALQPSPEIWLQRFSTACLRVEIRALQPSPQIWLQRVSLGRLRVENHGFLVILRLSEQQAAGGFARDLLHAVQAFALLSPRLSWHDCLLAVPGAAGRSQPLVNS